MTKEEIPGRFFTLDGEFHNSLEKVHSSEVRNRCIEKHIVDVSPMVVVYSCCLTEEHA